MVVLGVAVFLLAGEILYLWRDPRYVGYDFHTYAAAARVGRDDPAAPVPLAGAGCGAHGGAAAHGLAVRHAVLHGAVLPGRGIINPLVPIAAPRERAYPGV